MANSSFTVTVIDAWPKIKIEIRRGTNLRSEGPILYDAATTQFEPAVRDSLRLAVEDIIRQHKGGR